VWTFSITFLRGSAFLFHRVLFVIFVIDVSRSDISTTDITIMTHSLLYKKVK
jgi:hypothetical protein